MTTRVSFRLKPSLCDDPLAAIAALGRALQAARDVARGTPLSAIAEREWRDVLLTDDDPVRVAELVAKRIVADDVAILGKLLVSSRDEMRILEHLPEPWRERVRDAAIEELERNMTEQALEDPFADAAVSPLRSTPGRGRAQGIWERAPERLCELLRLGLLPARRAAELVVKLLQQSETSERAAKLVALLSHHATVDADPFCRELFESANETGLKESFTKVASQAPSLQYENYFVRGAQQWCVHRATLTLAARNSFGRIISSHHPIFSGCYLPSKDVSVAAASNGLFWIPGTAVGAAPLTPNSDGSTTGLDITRVIITPPAPPGVAQSHSEAELVFPSAVDAISKTGTIAAAWNHVEQRNPFISIIDCAKPTVAKDVFTVANTSIVTCLKALSPRLTTSSFCVGLCRTDKTHNLRIYNGSTAVREIEKAHDDYVLSLATSSENENLLLSASRDTTVKLWDSRGGKLVSTLKYHTDAVTSVTALRDMYLTASLDRRVGLWDSRKLAAPVATKEFSSGVLKVAAGPHAIFVVSCVDALVAASLHPLDVECVIPGAMYHDLRFVEIPGASHASSKPGRHWLVAMGATVDVYCVQASS